MDSLVDRITKSNFSNCFGFAYHSLGLQEKDTVRDIRTLDFLLKDFDITTKEKGRALLITKKSDLNSETLAVHIGVIDKNHPGFIKHRQNAGSEVENITEEEFLKPYLDSKFNKVYLIPKEASQPTSD